MIRLFELEKRVEADKQELQSLISEYNASMVKNAQIEGRIGRLRADIDQISAEIGRLKQSMAAQAGYGQPMQQPVQRAQPMQQPVQRAQSMQQPVQRAQSMQQPVQRAQSMQQSVQKTQSIPQPVQPQNKKSIEAFFGKNIMAVAASLLIFVSFIIFAGLLYPFLPDAVKIAVMYLISIAMTVTGVVLMSIHKENKWFVSLSAIGLGALYISIFLSNIHFGVINDVVTFILIFIWALIACILSKLKSRVFQVIGQIGIFVSVILGAVRCGNQSLECQEKFIVLLIYFIVISVIFWLTHLEKNSYKNIINIAFSTVSFIILMFDANLLVKVNSAAELSVVIAVMIAGFMLLYLVAGNAFRFVYYRVIENDYEFPITSIIYMLLTVIVLGFGKNILSSPWGSNIVNLAGFAFVMLVAVGAELKLRKQAVQKALIIIPAVIAALVYYASFNIAMFTGLYLFAAAALIYGFLRKDSFYKFFGFIILLIAVIHNNSGLDMYVGGYLQSIISIIIATVIVLAGMIFMCISKKQYSAFLKICSIAILVFNTIERLIVIVMDGILNFSPQVTILVLAAVFLMCLALIIYSPMVKNWKTGEKEIALDITLRSIIEFMVLICSVFMFLMNGALTNLLFTLILLAYGLFNTGIIIKKFKSIGAMYTGMKITYLVLILTVAFHAPNPVFSILCFLIAIACVVLGFIFRYKALRIYGLVLSLVCTIKLTLFDIQYDSTLGHAVSLFVCGMLCLVISLIYTVVEKRIGKNNK